MRGAFLLIAVPWLAFVFAANLHQVAHWIGYGVGNDNFKFQSYAYRVFMQGFWLEGGQLAFWNQPLYRWIAGSLHMIFGDSSVGEAYWDAGGVAIIALFAYPIVNRRAGFSGDCRCTLPLGMFLLGPTLEFVGFGLSEISSASFIYLAAFFAIRGRGWDAWSQAGSSPSPSIRGSTTFRWPGSRAFALPLEFPRARPSDRRFGGPRSAGASSSACRVTVDRLAAVFVANLVLQRRLQRFLRHPAGFSCCMEARHDAFRGLAAMLSSVMMVLTASDPPNLRGIRCRC